VISYVSRDNGNENYDDNEKHIKTLDTLPDLIKELDLIKEDKSDGLQLPGYLSPENLAVIAKFDKILDAVQDEDSYEIDKEDHEALDAAIGVTDATLDSEDKEARSTMSVKELQAAKKLYNAEIGDVIDSIGDVLNTFKDELLIDTNVNTPDPAVDTPDADEDTPDPAVDTPDADEDTPDPAVDITDPAVDTTDPAVDTPDADEDTPDPAVDTTDPAVDTTDPAVDTTDPAELMKRPQFKKQYKDNYSDGEEFKAAWRHYKKTGEVLEPVSQDAIDATETLSDKTDAAASDVETKQVSVIDENGQVVDDLTRSAFKQEIRNGEGGSDFRDAWRAYKDGERDSQDLLPQSYDDVEIGSFDEEFDKMPRNMKQVLRWIFLDKHGLGIESDGSDTDNMRQVFRMVKKVNIGSAFDINFDTVDWDADRADVRTALDDAGYHAKDGKKIRVREIRALEGIAQLQSEGDANNVKKLFEYIDAMADV
jgi:hypothetical protein